MRATRDVGREALRVDVRVAHIGFVLTAVAITGISVAWSLKIGAVIAAVFAVWFLVALGIALLAGNRGRNAIRGAYKATFWWADWINF
ncbi:hypothetical protein [Streptomyces sp. SGAir0957]